MSALDIVQTRVYEVGLVWADQQQLVHSIPGARKAARQAKPGAVRDALVAKVDEMHVRAWLDDRKRIMALAIHNSDVSDGWEREGENDGYFHRYSEKIAYPLGINLIVYLMTH